MEKFSARVLSPTRVLSFELWKVSRRSCDAWQGWTSLRPELCLPRVAKFWNSGKVSWRSFGFAPGLQSFQWWKSSQTEFCLLAGVLDFGTLENFSSPRPEFSRQGFRVCKFPEVPRGSSLSRPGIPSLKSWRSFSPEFFCLTGV